MSQLGLLLSLAIVYLCWNRYWVRVGVLWLSSLFSSFFCFCFVSFFCSFWEPRFVYSWRD
ncbi:hypothetical protein BKA57DRAFT_472280 [Linnemannia elongata]|nr:hypothetical protein BKA57DRAFT_472280 [Linnemannia elongata]